MAISMPATWESLTRTTIDLGDVLGAPGLEPRALARRASGAFDVAVAQIGPSTSVQLLARRTLVEPGLGATAVPARAAGLAENFVPVDSKADGADRRKVHTLESATGAHVVMQQQVRGCDVAGGRFVVHFDGAGAYGVTGHPLGDLASRDPGPPPKKAGARKAEAAIREQFVVEKGSPLEPRAVVLPVDGAAVWAWFAKVQLRDPIADLRVFLDTKTLEPLVTYPASIPALFGEASAYPVNPKRHADPSPVCLRDLGPDPTDRLSGARVVVEPDQGRPCQSATRSFVFEADHKSFDEAAAFHHVTRALHYFDDLVRSELFDAPMFKPLQVIVHHRDSVNNAYFHPDRGLITFGDFASGPTTARSADIVIHEVGHAITHAIARLSDTPAVQALALAEGYSDYFSCSALDDPRFGDYVMNQPDGARNCAKTGIDLRGSNLDAVAKYTLGEAWANVLWAVREQIGAGVADVLVIESLYFAPTISTVAEGVAALHTADAALFPTRAGGRGRHFDAIDQEFKTRFG